MQRLLPFRLPRRVAWGLLLVIAVGTMFFQLGDYRRLTSHEVVAAVPAREMLHSGDWVVPRYGMVPRLQKPPLVYWLIAANGWLFGTFDAFTVRLHSVVASLALMGLVSLWAARWYGREAAFGAGLMQISSLWVLKFGRRAEVDMLLCLLICLSLFLIAQQPEHEPKSRRWLRWLAIESLLGAMWLAKFHYGPAMVLGPTFVFWAMQRRWQRFLDLFHPLGMLIALACVVVWPWLVWRQLPEALSIWKLEIIGRAVGELGRDPWWFYLPSLVGMTLPWTGNVLLAAPISWLRAWRGGDVRECFVWTWLLIDLAIVWLSSDKHENYLLAAMPPCTLLACQTHARIAAKAHRGVLRLAAFVPSAGAAAAVVLGVVLFVFVAPKWPIVQGHTRLTAVCLTGGFVAACFWLRRQQPALAGWTALAGLSVSYLIVVASILPAQDSRHFTAQFARQLRRDVLHADPVCMFGERGNLRGIHPLVYELDEPVYRVNSIEDLAKQLRERGEMMMVIEEQRLAELEPLARVQVLQRMALPADGRPRAPSLTCVRLWPLETRSPASPLVESPTAGRATSTQ